MHILNKGNSLDFVESADLIFTDPPFDISPELLANIINQNECNHLVMLCTLKMVIDLTKISNWVLNFDFVFDTVSPKKSLSKRVPHYTHVIGVYMTRNKAKSIFDRTLRTRSDCVEGKNYFPTVVYAPKERRQEHGMAKNLTAITDVLGCFEAKTVYDPFAGSGTVLLACAELGKTCISTEIDEHNQELIEQKINFLS